MVAFDEDGRQAAPHGGGASTEQNERLEQINARATRRGRKRKPGPARDGADQQSHWASRSRGRSRLERERERVIAELESRNTEMEHFTYTVSHDLKSPARDDPRVFIGMLRGQVGSGDLAAMRHGLARVDAAAASCSSSSTSSSSYPGSAASSMSRSTST